MNSLPANKNLGFEVTFSPGLLYVAMKVLDITNGVIGSTQTVPMAEQLPGTYVGFFQGANNKSYLFQKAVYTDNTYTTLNPDYGIASESAAFVDNNLDIILAYMRGNLRGIIQQPVLVGKVDVLK